MFQTGERKHGFSKFRQLIYECNCATVLLLAMHACVTQGGVLWILYDVFSRGLPYWIAYSADSLMFKLKFTVNHFL